MRSQIFKWQIFVVGLLESADSFILNEKSYLSSLANKSTHAKLWDFDKTHFMSVWVHVRKIYAATNWERGFIASII